MKKYKEVYVGKIEYSEIDFLEPYWTRGEEDPNEIDYLGNVDTDTISISIDTVIKTLKAFKGKGAQHVYIYPHVDHIGYIFTGVKFEEII